MTELLGHVSTASLATVGGKTRLHCHLGPDSNTACVAYTPLSIIKSAEILILYNVGLFKGTAIIIYDKYL